MLELSKIKVTKISEKDNFGEFIVEPLDPGFGHTLGNSLRRVLLSSLSGGAVTYVKIAGIRHQFSTMEGMSEDIIELVLNLKKLRLKIRQDQPVKLILDVKGTKQALASDIKVPSGAEIINPKLVIANLSGSKAKLSAEITVEKGEGYVMAEERRTNEIGVIPVDSQFSPVVRVNYTVDATRVGRVTNYDKLTISVYTDGTVKPSEAIKQAAMILVDHFRLLFEPNAVASEPIVDKRPTPSVSDDVLKMTIEELDLPVRVVNALRAGGVETVEDFINTPKEVRLKIKNLGAKSDQQVEEKLKEKGLSI